MNLEQIFAAIASHMQAQFEIFSAQYQHRGLRGGSREDIVKEFLSTYLPAHVEITSGEIFDVTGAHSPECDIVILDRLKVPLMFGGGKRMVPVEGIYSVIEVKSHLDSNQLCDSLEKCTKVKSLKKRAYFPQTGAVLTTVNAYGKEFDYFPTLFSVFAYHGINPKTLISKVEDFCKSKPTEETLDSVVCLDGWLICWWNPKADQYDLIASPGSCLAIVEAEQNPLLFFYLMFYRWLSQASCRPIRMTDYTQNVSLGKRTYPTSEGSNE